MGILEVPVDTPVIREVEESLEGTVTVRLNQLALAKKQLEFKAAKLELQKYEMNHEFAVKKIELEMHAKTQSNDFDVDPKSVDGSSFLRKGG